MPIDAYGTAYQIHGSNDAPALVLIHGIGLSQFIWQDYLDTFASKYRVISYDLIGHGLSQLTTEEINLTTLSEQLLHLLETLNIKRCVLVGFSIGGMINRRFAIDYPDKVAALVILNSPHKRSAKAQKMVEERAAKTNVGGAAATIDETLARWFSADFIEKKANKVAKIRQLVLANDAKTYAKYRQILASGVLELINPQPAIEKPTLVMTCENDSGSTVQMSRDIAAEIQGGQVDIVADLKHLGLLEKPQRFSQTILNFLKKYD